MAATRKAAKKAATKTGKKAGKKSAKKPAKKVAKKAAKKALKKAATKAAKKVARKVKKAGKPAKKPARKAQKSAARPEKKKLQKVTSKPVAKPIKTATPRAAAGSKLAAPGVNKAAQPTGTNQVTKKQTAAPETRPMSGPLQPPAVTVVLPTRKPGEEAPKPGASGREFDDEAELEEFDPLFDEVREERD